MHRYISIPSKVAFLCLIAPFYLTYFACSCGYECFQFRHTGKPIPFYCGTGHSRAVRNWEMQRVQKKEAPDPLPARRKRALTIPDVSLNASLMKGRKATSSQLQSILFGMFPLEIREKIYVYTLASSSHIHLYRRADRRLGHYGCDDENRHQKCPPGLSWGYDQTLSGAWNVDKNANRERDDLLSLLMTCRRTYVSLYALPLEYVQKSYTCLPRSRYSEATDILYTHNIFYYPDAKTREYFCQTVLAKRLGMTDVLPGMTG